MRGGCPNRLLPARSSASRAGDPDRTNVEGLPSRSSPAFRSAARSAQPQLAGMKMLAPKQVPELADAPLAHGFSDADLGAMLDGNWLRIARQVWQD